MLNIKPSVTLPGREIDNKLTFRGLLEDLSPHSIEKHKPDKQDSKVHWS